MHTPRLALVGLLSLALSPSALLPTSASAQAATTPISDGEVEARARFELGQLYYSQGRFTEAEAEFQAAYAHHPHPDLLHNLFLARRDAGNVAGAADALSRYLASAATLSANDRRLLEGRLSGMRRQLEALGAAEGGGGEPGPSPGPSATEQNVAVDDRPAVPGEASQEELSASEAPSSDISASESSGAGVALGSPVASSGSGLGVVPGAVVLAVGGAALVGAAIAAGVAEGVRGERDAMCTLAGGACPASVDQDAYLARFNAARDAGWGLLVAGGVVAAVGAVLLGVGASESRDDVQVNAACGWQGCMASLTGAF